MKIESSNQPEVAREIERKFKVKGLPENLESYPKKSVRQGYISILDDGTEIRVRHKNEKYYKTIKSGIRVSREETENEITQEEFEKLWLETEGRRIEKTRYEITLADGNLAELDIYGGELEGLMVVEVEFSDENKAHEFIPPEWFGEDVTDNSSYKNASLAVNGSPEKIAEKPVFELEGGVEFLKKKIESKKNEQEGPLIVLVAGGSASGKTSAVADKLHKAFTDESIILSLDDYYRGRKFMEEMTAQGINYNYDQPEVINLDLFNTHLNFLKSGQAIEKPIYNFSIGEADKTEKVEPKKIIIVEGLFALNEKLLDVGDVKVFVEVDTHGRLVRRILRDIESRGQNPDNILDYFAKVVEPMHQEYIESTKKSADVVIINEYNPEVEARGMKEVQLKFKGAINQEKLRKLGAERIGSSVQVDTYYNPKDRDLKETGEVLRVREENGHNIVSYKGPKQSGDFRVRPKIDFEIDQGTRNTFVSMYGGETLIIKKERTLYQLDGVTFSVDKVVKVEDGAEKELGDFIEIRGVNSSDENKLGQVVELLSFKITDGDKRAYSEM
jgi:predicted adenylyl cyclase CyaB